jgi:hypothetical protein
MKEAMLSRDSRELAERKRRGAGPPCNWRRCRESLVGFPVDGRITAKWATLLLGGPGAQPFGQPQLYRAGVSQRSIGFSTA